VKEEEEEKEEEEVENRRGVPGFDDSAIEIKPR